MVSNKKISIGDSWSGLIIFLLTLNMGLSGKSFANCGQIIKATQNAEIIAPGGAVSAQTLLNQPQKSIENGSMLMTHQGMIWVKFENGSGIKVGPESALEIESQPQSDCGTKITLYRGRAYVQSPPVQREFKIKTPQAELVSKGGAFWLEYLPSEQKTQVGVFNRSLKFYNQFHETAWVEVPAGMMSSMSANDIKVIPERPRVIEPQALKILLSKLGLAQEEQESIQEVVAQAQHDHQHSLMSDLESWKSIKTSPSKEEPVRPSPKASLAAASPQPYYENMSEKKSSEALSRLKARVYEGLQTTTESNRSPASVRQSTTYRQPMSDRIEDPEYFIQKNKIESEKDLLLKKLGQIKEEP